MIKFSILRRLRFVFISYFLVSSVICFDAGVRKYEDSQSITFENEFIVASYDKSNGTYKVSLKPRARSIGGFEKWHLDDPMDHYLRLKDQYELQLDSEEMEPKDPEETEEFKIYRHLGQNEN